jgi:NADPH-dependent curcumin reductase CurA
MPTVDNFELVTVSVPEPAPNEVQVKNLWMSVDPYMRGRMVDRTSYDPHLPVGAATPAREIGEVAASNSTMYGWRPQFQLGEVLQGGAVGEVVASEDPGFKPGDLVSSMFGWRDHDHAAGGCGEHQSDHAGQRDSRNYSWRDSERKSTDELTERS